MPANFQREKDSQLSPFSLISAFTESFPFLKMNCICYQQNSNLITFCNLSLARPPGLETQTYSCVLPLFSLSFYHGAARLQAEKPLQDLKSMGSHFKLGHHLLATASLLLSTVYTSLLFSVITPLI